MKKGSVYYAEIPEKYQGKKLEHMLGENLIAKALLEEYGLHLDDEPRSRGEFGKPFFSFQPSIHYNISYSGKYIYCIIAETPVGIDIQIETEMDYPLVLKRLVPENRAQEILQAENITEEFFREWVKREAFIKFTGEGLSRDTKKLRLDDAWYHPFSPAKGYHGGLYSVTPLDLKWVSTQVSLF